MNDEERIHTAIEEMMRYAGGALSTQTIAHLLSHYLEAEGHTPTSPRTYHYTPLEEAILFLTLVASIAESLSEEPSNWTFQGRFSQALYAHHYQVKESTRVHDVYTTLMGVLGKLDAHYQEKFSVESATHFLLDVKECALRLTEELSK